jgi:hypothetical protein
MNGRKEARRIEKEIAVFVQVDEWFLPLKG